MITLVAAGILFGVLLFTDAKAAGDLGVAFGLTIVLIFAMKSLGAALATRVTKRPIDERFVMDLACMWLMEVLLLPALARAQWEGLRLRRAPFVRTPKIG